MLKLEQMRVASMDEQKKWFPEMAQPPLPSATTTLNSQQSSTLRYNSPPAKNYNSFEEAQMTVSIFKQ